VRTRAATVEDVEAREVILPGMKEYLAICGANRIGNAPEERPLAIVRCSEETHVRAVLRDAIASGLPITCRAGGHSTARFSLCSGIVLDVGGFDRVELDVARNVVRVGAGARLGAVNAVLGAADLHVPGGACDGVGVGGHVQAGGYGVTSRLFGLNCDAAIAATWVLADGRVVRAAREENADLFWAMRGGTGNNFGVLLEVEYAAVSLPRLRGQMFRCRGHLAAPALGRAFALFAREPSLGGLVVLRADSRGPSLLVLTVSLDGSSSRTAARFSDLMPEVMFEGKLPYPDLNRLLGSYLPRSAPEHAVKHQRSRILTRPPSDATTRAIVASIANATNPHHVVVFEPYGGAIAAVPAYRSAFVHRAAVGNLLAMTFSYEGMSGTAATRWVDGFLHTIDGYHRGGVSPSYPERDLTDYRFAYWGEAFPALLDVKRKFDPHNVFHFPQSIC
jgi:FAD/FMN-containing dehydrogenase